MLFTQCECLERVLGSISCAARGVDPSACHILDLDLAFAQFGTPEPPPLLVPRTHSRIMERGLTNVMARTSRYVPKFRRCPIAHGAVRYSGGSADFARFPTAQYCDPNRQYTNITAILQSFGETELLADMKVNWPDYQGNVSVSAVRQPLRTL